MRLYCILQKLSACVLQALFDLFILLTEMHERKDADRLIHHAAGACLPPRASPSDDIFVSIPVISPRILVLIIIRIKHYPLRTDRA